MIRKEVKSGVYVDSEGYLLDKENKRIKKYPKRLDVREHNMVQTYFWFYDLQGRLKQDIYPPAEYHGNPRAYVQEDIEEDRDENLITSHLRYYLGKKLIAYTTITIPEFTESYLGTKESTSYPERRRMVTFLLDGGWTYYKIEPRRKKRTTHIKRKITKKPVRKVVKKRTKKKRKI